MVELHLKIGNKYSARFKRLRKDSVKSGESPFPERTPKSRVGVGGGGQRTRTCHGVGSFLCARLAGLSRSAVSGEPSPLGTALQTQSVSPPGQTHPDRAVDLVMWSLRYAPTSHLAPCSLTKRTAPKLT